jgi:hypothetical protein
LEKKSGTAREKRTAESAKAMISSARLVRGESHHFQIELPAREWLDDFARNGFIGKESSLIRANSKAFDPDAAKPAPRIRPVRHGRTSNVSRAIGPGV